MFLVKSSTKVYLGCDPLPGCQWFSSGVLGVKGYSLTGKMYENPGGSWWHPGQKGGPRPKFSLLPSTFRDGQKVGCHLLLFTASRDCRMRRFCPSKRDGKNPMAKWISRLLSVHAVVRSAHDACCTLTSEYVTNSECWSPCSNVADSEGWMGLVRKNEGFHPRNFYPPKKREDWKMQMKWTPFFLVLNDIETWILLFEVLNLRDTPWFWLSFLVGSFQHIS